MIRAQVADLRALADEHAAHAHDDDHRAEAALRSIAAHVSDDGDDAPAEVEGAERRAARESRASYFRVAAARKAAARWRKRARQARDRDARRPGAARATTTAQDLAELKAEAVAALGEFYEITRAAVVGRFAAGDDDRGNAKLREAREANARLEARLRDETALRDRLDGEADDRRAAILATITTALSERLGRHRQLCAESWTEFRGAEARLAFARAAGDDTRAAAAAEAEDAAKQRAAHRRATMMV